MEGVVLIKLFKRILELREKGNEYLLKGADEIEN